MICSICGDREAVVFMRHSATATRGELALCEECAALRGLSVGKGRLELRFEDLLAEAPPNGAPPVARCPHCGSDLDLVRREARIGCPACAEVFRPEIERYMRTRSRPPYYREAPLAASPAMEGPRPELLSLLNRALAEEDYEAAALIRDGLALGAGPGAAGQGPGPAGSSPAAARGRGVQGEGLLAILAPTIPLKAQAVIPSGEASEADVVLETRARRSRNFSGELFPGRAGLGCAPSLGLAARLEEFSASLPGYALVDAAGLAREVVPALAELGLLPRRASLDSRAPIILAPAGDSYLLFCQDSHLEARTRQRGLAAAASLALLRAAMEAFSSFGAYAFDEDFGFLAPRLQDCGTGLCLESLVHLPALAQEGLVEKALRGLLSRGFQVKGFYGSEEGSLGDLWLVGTEWAFGASEEDIASEFEAALAALARGERKARAGLMRKRREEVLDRAGRALGLFSNCRFLGASEAAENLSALRLAALEGELTGIDPARLGMLVGCLGPAFLEYLSTLNPLAPAEALPGEAVKGRRWDERLRAAWLAAATMGGALKEVSHV